MISIKVELKGGYQALRRQVMEGVDAGFLAALSAVEAKARELASVKKGKLRKSISARPVGPLKGVLRAGAPYASFLHRGTGLYGPKKRRIHIEPVFRKALWWPGAWHPVKSVDTKGIKPRWFIRRAVMHGFVARAFEEGFKKWWAGR